MKQFKEINQSTSAKRKIKSLANNSSLDLKLVTLLASVSWDYDLDPMFGEPFGWVENEQLKCKHGQNALNGISDLLDLDPLSKDFLIENILNTYNNIHRDTIYQKFLISGKTNNFAYLSEYATFHYLNNLTKENLNLLDFKEELAVIDVATLLFRKIFNGGVGNRHVLNYCYVDLCIKLPYLENLKSKEFDWTKNVIKKVEELPAKSTLSDLIQCTKSEVKGNKYFRQEILQALSYAGVLKVGNIETKNMFIPKYRNELSSHFYSNEWTFPLRFWAEKEIIDSKQYT